MAGDSSSESGERVSSQDAPLAASRALMGLRPWICTDLVLRTAVLAELIASAASLVVLSAPAGSGKTTVLLQWIERELRPHAWLTLEAAHNDPSVLVTGLATSLGHVAPVDPRVDRWAHLAVPPLRERILPSLRASLAQAPPFVMVLDDAHLVGNKASWEIVENLLGALPAGAQMALGARTEPPLPLARLEAAGQLLQLGGDELAFSIQETVALLNLRGLKADEQAAAALQAATEGWAAGISLATLACGGSCTVDWVATIDGRQRAIARYLISEVLERQSRSVQAFLLQTSILDRLSESSCRAVSGRGDSGTLLARLCRDNVFVSPLDQKGDWYRHHHLFAELLNDELKRREGSKVGELHRRAAVWSEEHGDLEAAVRHWLAAGDVPRAGDVVCRGHFLHSSFGQVETVRRWLDFFAYEHIRGNTALALTAGWVAYMVAASGSDRSWIGAALAADADDSPLPYGGGTERAFQVTLRAMLAPDGVTAMRRDAELAARLAVDCHPAWRSVVDVALGAAYWLSDSPSRADRAFHRAIQEGHVHNVVTELTALGSVSLLLADQGRWEEAEAEAARARRRLEESEVGHGPMGLPTLLAEARVSAHYGTHDLGSKIEAIETLLGRFWLPEWHLLTASVILAEVALSGGDVTRAEHWVARSASILHTWTDAGIFRQRVDRLRRALLELRQLEPLTPMEERVLELLATHLTSTEIAESLVISRNTLKTHLRSLYRKLDVHSRSEAVGRARELSLLGG